MGTTIESDWECERLKEQLSAANAEIERLSADLKHTENCCVEWAADVGNLSKQLAASQLREKNLREALELCYENSLLYHPEIVRKALSTPTDDSKDGHSPDLSALRNYVADEMVKMKDAYCSYAGTAFIIKEYAERYRKG